MASKIVMADICAAIRNPAPVGVFAPAQSKQDSTPRTQRTANNANGPVAACGTVTLLACWGGEARRCRLVTAAFALFALFALFAFFALNLAAAACQP
jgi:hypothetical protein